MNDIFVDMKLADPHKYQKQYKGYVCPVQHILHQKTFCSAFLTVLETITTTSTTTVKILVFTGVIRKSGKRKK
uniref:Uncharacterized protein n=1 Tax=Romanomermis culicivorax TaxID=13658 RepID=A0A915I430_ROMCU